MYTRSVLFALTFGILFLIPLAVQAGITKKADDMCKPVIIDQCGCHKKYVPKKGCVADPNMHLCPCWDDPPGGHVSGICVAQINCEGKTSTDQQGKTQGMGDAKGMMDALKGIMDMLKGKGGGGG